MVSCARDFRERGLLYFYSLFTLLWYPPKFAIFPTYRWSSDDRAMTERRARQKMPIFWPKTNKNYIFIPQNLYMSKKYRTFAPDWMHCATRAYNKVSIQKDSIYVGLPWAGGLEGWRYATERTSSAVPEEFPLRGGSTNIESVTYWEGVYWRFVIGTQKA